MAKRKDLKDFEAREVMRYVLTAKGADTPETQEELYAKAEFEEVPGLGTVTYVKAGIFLRTPDRRREGIVPWEQLRKEARTQRILRGSGS